ncbi:MAG: hypothetical protein ACD_20C00157G0023 [uncultured bacterium]|nr:MAG: hypothetical protein ACD_20C00157G0023 [uncultured bacterium]HBH18139.1 hypothetical protein [Cyanobacteria bacterium UBA9579]
MHGKIAQNSIIMPKLCDKNVDAQVAVWYMNDVHAQISKMAQLKSSADNFTRKFQNKAEIDSFKVAAGDTLMGSNEKKNNLCIQFLNLIRLDVTAIGNHEFDSEELKLTKLLSGANFKSIITNAKIKLISPLKRLVRDNKIVKSHIINKNGHKYGFVGTIPSDLNEIKGDFQKLNGISVKNINETVKELQKEVNNLEKKGVNKIILVSHSGYENDCQIAKNVEGIDIIIGGHSHNLIRPDQSLIMAPSGKPVIIAQAGKNGDYTGILNAKFNKEGVIIAAANQVLETSKFQKNPEVEKLKDEVLGQAQLVGTLQNSCNLDNPNSQENPIANLITDSAKQKTGAQAVLLNSGTLRGGLNKGLITSRNLEELIFFPSRFVKVELSEKNIIDALNHGIRNFDTKPEILQVSGLKYTIDSSSKTVKDVFIENSDGNWTKIDNNNPREDKKYPVAYNEFMFAGGIGYSMLKKPESLIEFYNWSELDSVIEYIKTFNKPIQLKPEGRITVE